MVDVGGCEGESILQRQRTELIILLISWPVLSLAFSWSNSQFFDFLWSLCHTSFLLLPWETILISYIVSVSVCITIYICVYLYNNVKWFTSVELWKGHESYISTPTFSPWNSMLQGHSILFCAHFYGMNNGHEATMDSYFSWFKDCAVGRTWSYLCLCSRLWSLLRIQATGIVWTLSLFVVFYLGFFTSCFLMVPRE